MRHHVLPTLGGRNGDGGLSAKTVRYIHTFIHKSTLKQYAHVIPGMQADAAKKVADLSLIHI